MQATGSVECERIRFFMMAMNPVTKLSHFTCVFLAQSNMVSFLHSSYSPGLAPADLHHFYKMKKLLEGRYFSTMLLKTREDWRRSTACLKKNGFQARFQRGRNTGTLLQKVTTLKEIMLRQLLW